jgi:hypothetical protein
MMTDKPYISNNIIESVQTFNQLIQELDADEFERSVDGKWSAGQDLAHLIKTVKIIGLAFILPKFLLKFLFGKANRPSRSPEELYEKYKGSLAQGGKAPAAFIPKKVRYAQADGLLQQHEYYGNQLIKRLNKISEEDLDTYLLPHPLIGKIT